MQTLDPALTNHLAQEVTTLAMCWSIVRTDAVAYYYTSHDRDLVVAGTTYKAASIMSPSAVTSMINLATDNMEFEGMLQDDGIAQEDILSGRFDHARIRMFMVNYQQPDAGTLHLKQGLLGEVTLRNGLFVVEVRGISSVLQQTIGEVYTPTCRVKLGDARCGVNLASYSFMGTVTIAEGAHAFSDENREEANGYFTNGVLTFLSGDNASLSIEVRDYSAGKFSLFLPMPKTITVGDTYRVVAGCDKRLDTCINRFSNVLNFRGEPHVPGTDKMMETSATRSKT